MIKMLPFIAPFALYLIFSQFSGQFPDHFPLFYTVSVVVVGVTTVFLLRGLDILRMHRNVVPGIIFGIAGVVLWIFISRLQLEQSIMWILPEWLQPSEREAFDPFLSIDNTANQWAFITIRLMGLALLVPVVEEIFWRGFLLRWVISPDWQDQKLGVFTLKSFLWVTFLFTLAHPEWIAAAVYFSLISVLFYWKRDLWNCIVAHSTSNLLLGIYVISTRTWELW